MFVWKRACQVDWCVGRRTLCLKEKSVYCIAFVGIRVHYVWVRAKGVHYVLFISKRAQHAWLKQNQWTVVENSGNMAMEMN